jgi:DsbC/DsbD-like thiol-disulfide interchange protein
MNHHRAFVVLVACVAALSALTRAEAASVQAEHLNVELISEAPAVEPGQTAWLGLVLRHDPHWHSYWINPGDSGLPTRLKWTLPDGFSVDEVSWPAPSRFEIGGLFNFGYAGDHLLPIALHVPADAVPGQRAALSVDATWLVCREACITGSATLKLDVPIAARAGTPSQTQHNLFTAARMSSPKAAAWTGTARIEGDHVRIALRGEELPALDGLDVFAVQRRVLGNAPVILKREGDSLLIDAAKNEYLDQAPSALDVVLTQRMTNGRLHAWQVRVVFDSSSPKD